MTLRILIFALMLTAIHAQEPQVAPDSALAYQAARANALEAENAVLKRTIQQKQFEIEWYKAQLDVNVLQAKADAAAKELEAAKPKETKETK